MELSRKAQVAMASPWRAFRVHPFPSPPQVFFGATDKKSPRCGGDGRGEKGAAEKGQGPRPKGIDRAPRNASPTTSPLPGSKAISRLPYLCHRQRAPPPREKEGQEAAKSPNAPPPPRLPPARRGKGASSGERRGQGRPALPRPTGGPRDKDTNEEDRRRPSKVTCQAWGVLGVRLK